MRKRSFVIFAVVAVGFGIAIPYWATTNKGGGASQEPVPAADEYARDLFVRNCGACHTLELAGTDGIVGPDLDELLGQGTPEANRQRVATAIENGVQGRMPAGILDGENAEAVADFVARATGQ